MKVGLFFGSFNPIHMGHLIIAETALDEAKLDRVWFVVSPQNPFKDKKSLLHEQDRIRMVEMAIGDNYRLLASNVEFLMPQPSYTIDTLTYLSEKYKSYTFSLIMGADNLQFLHKWKNYEAILNYYKIHVYPRPESVIPPQYENHPSIALFQAPLLDISATYIRQRIKDNKSIHYLLPESVEQFIKKKQLYTT